MGARQTAYTLGNFEVARNIIEATPHTSVRHLAQHLTISSLNVYYIVMSISENFPYRYFSKFGKRENRRTDTPAGALRSTLLSYHKEVLLLTKPEKPRLENITF